MDRGRHHARCVRPNMHYVQTNLVSDTAGNAANTDPNLKGLWGVSQSPASPFWVFRYR